MLSTDQPQSGHLPSDTAEVEIGPRYNADARSLAVYRQFAIMLCILVCSSVYVCSSVILHLCFRSSRLYRFEADRRLDRSRAEIWQSCMQAQYVVFHRINVLRSCRNQRDFSAQACSDARTIWAIRWSHFSSSIPASLQSRLDRPLVVVAYIVRRLYRLFLARRFLLVPSP